MKLRPLGHRVIVRRDEAPSQSKGGILVPDTAKEKPLRGTVLAVGPGRLNADGTRQEMEVKEGDRILFPRYAGVESGADADGNVIVLQDVDLLAVVEDDGDEKPSTRPRRD